MIKLKQKDIEDGREQIRLDVAEQFDRFENADTMLEECSTRITDFERSVGWR